MLSVVDHCDTECGVRARFSSKPDHGEDPQLSRDSYGCPDGRPGPPRRLRARGRSNCVGKDVVDFAGHDHLAIDWDDVVDVVDRSERSRTIPPVTSTCHCRDRAEFWDDAAKSYADDHLEKVEVRGAGWEVVYRCPETGVDWLEDYPRSHEQGGGPMRLRRLDAP